jgi:glycopeptide antibiotics resistance protein
MSKGFKALVISTFIAYLFVAVWIYFFKSSLGQDLKFFYWESSMNWIPFSEVFGKNGFNSSEFWLQILNIIGFIPLGFFAAAVFKKHPFVFGAIFAVTFSILIETAQFITSFGSPQLGDIITNSTGGILGAFIYIKINKKVNIKIQTILYIIAINVLTILIVLGIVTTIIRWPEYL